ncbi:MAG: hypothetical protein ACE5GG_04560 [Candidatus Omnitrophota bacterium]
MTKKQIHDFNNGLNRITVICSWLRDRLMDEPLDKLSSCDLKELNKDLIKGLSDVEDAAMGLSRSLQKR